MSENFGRCRNCSGSGQVQERDPTLMRTTGKWLECGECHGSGNSGNAIDFLARESEAEWFAEMQEIMKGEGR